MKKRLFAVFVSLCMIVSMLPTMAFAEAGVQDSGNPTTPSDAQPKECICETLCTEEEINADCPVCSAEGAELDKVCTGAAPILAAAAPPSGEHSNHDGWKTLSGTINDSTLSAGNYVLTGDVTLGDGLEPDESITMCLNGHNINGNTKFVRNLTICDCTGNGDIVDCRNMGNIKCEPEGLHNNWINNDRR